MTPVSVAAVVTATGWEVPCAHGGLQGHRAAVEALPRQDARHAGGEKEPLEALPYADGLVSLRLRAGAPRII